MANGNPQRSLGESIGLALSGGDIDREGARLEGLNIGSQIQARRASTVNALAQARLRRDEAEARESLAESLDLGGNNAIAAVIRAGGNPEQAVGAQLGQQEMGLRDIISNVELPFEERQAAAQGVEGKVVDPMQFGPGGELFVDVFNPQDAPVVTDTGTAAIAADEALVRQRDASAALSDERRLHPERFRNNVTINTPGAQPLGDAILADIGDSTIPGDILPEEATGVTGALRSASNTLFDIANVNLPFEDADRAQNALTDLHKRTMIVGQQSVPGRPSNYLMQQLEAFGVEPNDVFRGDQRSLSRMSQTSSFLGGEIDRLRRILNAGRLTPSRIADHEDALRNLAALKQDYDVVISRFAVNREAAEAGGVETVTEGLPDGWSVTTVNP